MITDHVFLTSTERPTENSSPSSCAICAVGLHSRCGSDEYPGSVFLCKMRCTSCETCFHRPRDDTALTLATEPYVQFIKRHDPRQLTIHFTHCSVYAAHPSWPDGLPIFRALQKVRFIAGRNGQRTPSSIKRESEKAYRNLNTVQEETKQQLESTGSFHRQ